jgi:hypothetical protein
MGTILWDHFLKLRLVLYENFQLLFKRKDPRSEVLKSYVYCGSRSRSLEICVEIAKLYLVEFFLLMVRLNQILSIVYFVQHSMEKGKGKPPVGDNYDSVNMEMSDESDNEMFACKEEYQAFKTHFDNKAKSQKNEFSEYGGGPDTTHKAGLGIEYGSGPDPVAGSNEYGGGAPPVGHSEYGGGAMTTAGPSGHEARVGQGGYGHPSRGYHHQSAYPPRRSPSPPQPTPAKIEREPKLYKDGDKDNGKRSKSRYVTVFVLFNAFTYRI